MRMLRVWTWDITGLAARDIGHCRGVGLGLQDIGNSGIAGPAGVIERLCVCIQFAHHDPELPSARVQPDTNGTIQ